MLVTAPFLTYLLSSVSEISDSNLPRPLARAAFPVVSKQAVFAAASLPAASMQEVMVSARSLHAPSLIIFSTSLLVTEVFPVADKMAFLAVVALQASLAALSVAVSMHAFISFMAL